MASSKAGQQFNASSSGGEKYGLVYSAEAAFEGGSSTALVRDPDGTERVVEYTAMVKLADLRDFADRFGDSSTQWVGRESNMALIGEVPRAYLVYSAEHAKENGASTALVRNADGTTEVVEYTFAAASEEGLFAYKASDAKVAWKGPETNYEQLKESAPLHLGYSSEQAREYGSSLALVVKPDGTKTLAEYTCAAGSEKGLKEHKWPDLKTVWAGTENGCTDIGNYTATQNVLRAAKKILAAPVPITIKEEKSAPPPPPSSRNKNEGSKPPPPPSSRKSKPPVAQA